MPTMPTPSVREVLLSLVYEMSATRKGGNLQQSTLLDAAAKKLVPYHGNPDLEEAILTQWQELFRTGLLAWGYNLSNPNPPFFHLTDVGRRALANATRDPSNPDGYMRHLDARAKIGAVARSYLVESLDCYAAGLFKASAVMVGAAAEAVILDVRLFVQTKYEELGRSDLPSDLNSWKIRTVTSALTRIFNNGIDRKKNAALRERYEAYWSGFATQIRTTRNETGHPTTIEPVTPDAVHASLLIFPELAGLAWALCEWIADGMS